MEWMIKGEYDAIPATDKIYMSATYIDEFLLYFENAGNMTKYEQIFPTTICYTTKCHIRPIVENISFDSLLKNEECPSCFVRPNNIEIYDV